MTYTFAEASLFLYKYIYDQKTLVDIDLEPKRSDPKLSDLRVEFIGALDKYEKNLRVNLKNRLSGIQSSKPINDNDDNDIINDNEIDDNKIDDINMFKIEEVICNNTLMFYYSKPEHNIYMIIKTNRYARFSDIINYKEDTSTYSKLVAHIIYVKIQSMV